MERRENTEKGRKGGKVRRNLVKEERRKTHRRRGRGRKRHKKEGKREEETQKDRKREALSETRRKK